MDLDYVSVHNHAKKELGQNPAILTSHLVNNPSKQIKLHYIYLQLITYIIYGICNFLSYIIYMSFPLN